MEEKKSYENPAVEITYFEVEDVLSESNIELPGVSWGDSTGK